MDLENNTSSENRKQEIITMLTKGKEGVENETKSLWTSLKDSINSLMGTGLASNEKGVTISGPSEIPGYADTPIPQERMINRVLQPINTTPTRETNMPKTVGSKTPKEEQKTYEVKNGDNLFRIAQANNVSVENLKSWNMLKTDVIIPGQKIKIPIGNTKDVVENNKLMRQTMGINGENSEKDIKLDATISDTMFSFIYKLECGYSPDSDRAKTKKGHIRNGIQTLAKDGKKFLYPKDGPTIDPGIDLGQVEPQLLEDAFNGVLDPATLTLLINFSNHIKKYKKKYNKTLKTIPDEYEKLRNPELLKPEQLLIVSRRIMQSYWDKYIKRDIPLIDSPGFATDEIKAALGSIAYHRGGGYLRLHPSVLNKMRSGQWSHPDVIGLIGKPKGGSQAMIDRAKSEQQFFMEGVKKQEKNK